MIFSSWHSRYMPASERNWMKGGAGVGGAKLSLKLLHEKWYKQKNQNSKCNEHKLQHLSCSKSAWCDWCDESCRVLGVGVLGDVTFHHFGLQRKLKAKEHWAKEAKERKGNSETGIFAWLTFIRVSWQLASRLTAEGSKNRECEGKRGCNRCQMAKIFLESRVFKVQTCRI